MVRDFLLQDVFGDQWCYCDEELLMVERNLVAEYISPAELDWEERSDECEPSRPGQYTLNPETSDLDLEDATVVIPPDDDFVSLLGKPFHEVARFIQSHYELLMPGIEFWEHVYRYPDRFPQVGDTEYSYYYFGSVLRGMDGHWCVPASYWSARSLNSAQLTEPWSTSSRAILLNPRNVNEGRARGSAEIDP